MKNLFISILSVTLFMLAGCSGNIGKTNEIQEKRTPGVTLFEYLNSPVSYINTESPSIVEATDLYYSKASSFVVDMRKKEDYVNGHIEGAVNVPMQSLYSYLSDSINAGSYQKIVLVCYSGHMSSYATSLLRLAGFGNIFSLKWGIKAWNKNLTSVFSKSIGNASVAIDTLSQPAEKAGVLPEIKADTVYTHELLQQRVQKLLSEGFQPAKITIDSLVKTKEMFEVAAYLPEELYKKGHIEGALNIIPRLSMNTAADFEIISNNKPIVIYCLTGQSSSFFAGYLRLLGYDAKVLAFGMNSFMYDQMKKKEYPNVFSEEEYCQEFPIIEGENPSDKKSGNQSGMSQSKAPAMNLPVMGKKKKSVEGGC